MFSEEIILFQLVYIIPSIILYVTEIYVMFFGARKTIFNKSSFNKIFFIYAVNNIIAEILYYFFFRMRNSLIFAEVFEKVFKFRNILLFFWQLLFHTSMTTNLLDLVLSFNRFTATIMSVRYAGFWIGKIKWVVIFIILFPAVSFWSLPFRGIMLTQVNTSKVPRIDFIKPPPILWPSPTDILGACVTVTCVGCFFCNAYVGFKLHQRRNLMGELNYQQGKFYFLFIMCVFVNQILSCSTQVN